MDVQSLGEAGTPSAAPQSPVPQPQQQAAAVSSPAQPTNGSPAPSQPNSSDSSDKTLAHTVAGILGSPSSGSVHVSYRVEKPDEIVTVFTDGAGHEIAQVPSETMIQIAEFFQTQTGITLDRNA